MRVRGVELELHPPPDYVSDVIRSSGDFYEPEVLDEIRRRLSSRPAGVLVDVGAMIGNHTAYLEAFVHHTAIHAFEPVWANVELLNRNVAARPRVEVHPLALSDRARMLAMTIEPGNLGHSRVVAGEHSFEISAIALDSLELEGVALVKIDVEGHEPEVLAGAAATIARSRPLIVLEDWTGTYGALLPDYRLAAEWATEHQTYLYEWAI